MRSTFRNIGVERFVNSTQKKSEIESDFTLFKWNVYVRRARLIF